MDINIELKNLEMALNPFNKDILSDELENYIIRACEQQLLKNKDLNINITGLNSLEDQKKLNNTIHTYYQNKNTIYNKIDSVDNYIRITLTCIGAIVILISHEFDFLLSELFLIAGWVIIWEIVYDLLFNEIKRKRKKKIFSRLSTVKINFKK